MFSIRMRASKTAKSADSAEVRRRGSITNRTSRLAGSPTCRLNKIHISGAEGIYHEKDVRKVCNEYIQRALTHPRGRPDEIFITIEKLIQRPQIVRLLQAGTLKCSTPREAEKIMKERLSGIGVSQKAINNAFKILRSKKTMRGASLMLMKSGAHVEPDKERGVRVSRMGMDKLAGKKLSRMLSEMKINTATVKEALILASKVASCPSVIAEVCISDDPDYTTGYFASKKSGYLRIPNIKKAGEMNGGRVFFVEEDADTVRLISFLERTPVIIR